MPKTGTAEVAKRESADLSTLTPAELRSLDTPEKLMEFYQAEGLEVADITEYGDGFPVLVGDAKKKLVGRAFHLIAWKPFVSKKYGCNGVMAWVMTNNVNPVTKEYERYRLVDLSQGVARQLIDEIGDRRPMMVPNGLTRSEYDTEINGETVHGVTYYLDTTPAA